MNILFVGNSYTFGRGTAALQYNASNVEDLTLAFNNLSPQSGSSPVGTGVAPTSCKDTSGAVGCYSPKPWGGVPGIFKALADEIGLNYTVAISARSAATLRGQFLNTADPAWDLRGNLASKKWDVVVLQGQSDEPLPRAKSKNGNPLSFSTYANQIAQYIQNGDAAETTEAAIFGSLMNCTNPVTATPQELAYQLLTAIRHAASQKTPLPTQLQSSISRKPGLGPIWWNPTNASMTTSPQWLGRHL